MWKNFKNSKAPEKNKHSFKKKSVYVANQQLSYKNGSVIYTTERWIM